MVKVKICGNTNKQDALECASLGADAIGTVVEVPVDTPKKISSLKAKEIISSLPIFTCGVIVIMPKSIEEALQFYEQVKPCALQLHGNESTDFVEGLKDKISCKIIKAIHVKGEDSIKEAKKFSRHCDAILLDTYTKGLGGSGMTHNWDISRRIARSIEKPVILAGGLTPENVRDAIEFVRPYAVDVSSGVEKEKGKKDYEKVKRFIEEAKIT